MQILRGAEIEAHIEELGRFRIRIFKEYPYLYEGDLEYEGQYLSRYVRDPQSFFIRIEDECGLVGACTGIPLASEDQAFRQAFASERIEEIYYLGEIMVRQDCRRKQWGSRLLAAAVSLIDPMRFAKVCLCAVDRGPRHPLRPVNYWSPDDLWSKYGFVRHPTLVTHLEWKDCGDAVATQKPMQAWFRRHGEK